MSWKSIAGNQTVSRANLQNAIDTGVFIQRNGVPGTETNRQITKANARDYVYTWDLYPPFRSKTLNQLPVKSNLAVQSNITYAYTSQQVWIGNTNRSWLCYIFSAGSDDWGSIASSTNNRCILAGKRYNAGSGGGSAYLSTDFGESFTRLDTIMTTNDAAMAAAMNTYGDYMIITRQVGSFGSQRAYIYWSPNLGVSWGVGYHDSIDYNFNGAAMSGVGVYATVLGSDNTSYYVWTSNSFGSTFTKTYLCNGIKQIVGDCVGMSKSGQYQLLTPPRSTSPDVGKCFLSTNYGTTWTSFYLTVPPVIAYDIFLGCSVSAGGDYMTIVGQSSVSSDTRTFISNDFGATWSLVSGGSIAQAVDSSGQFQYQSSRVSIDYGNTWTAGFNSYAISVNSTTYTTPYIYGVLNGVDYPVVSTDQGVTFSSLSSGIGTGDYNDIACSGGENNGKYVVVISRNSSGYTYLLKSSDYGVTFSTLTYYGGTNEFKRVAISDDGLHILAAVYDSSTQRSTLLYSVDGGSFNAATISGLTYVDGEIKALCIAKISGGSGGFIVYQQSNNTSYVYKATYTNSISSWTSTGYSSNTTKYNDMSCSGGGKYMTMVSRDNSDNSGRVFYSNNYGASWTERLYSGSPDGRYSGLYCDNSSLNGVAIAGGIDYRDLTSRVWVTGDYWANYQAYTLPFLLPLAGDKLAGINISSDATYWTLVVNNQYHTFTNSTGNATSWTQNTIGSLLDFRRLSK
jgi:hypothetical protein